MKSGGKGGRTILFNPLADCDRMPNVTMFRSVSSVRSIREGCFFAESDCDHFIASMGVSVCEL